MSRSTVNKLLLLSASGILLSIASLVIGRYDFDLTDPQFLFVLTELRLPRVLAAISVAVCAAMAALLMQLLLKNRVAEPALFGATSFASIGTIFGILIGFGFGSVQTWLLAALASLLGLGPLFILARRVNALGPRWGANAQANLPLIGISFGAFATAAVGLASFVIPDARLRSVSLWAFGSLSLQTSASAAVLGLITLVLAAVTIASSGWLGRLALGSSILRGLGVSETRLFILTLGLVALMSATQSYSTGSIAFLGLMSTTLSRIWFEKILKVQLLGASLIAINLLVASDLFARTIAPPLELPLGLITAVIGVPILVASLLRESRAR